jgi:hypothetical protein
LNKYHRHMFSFCELLGEKEFKQLPRIEIHIDFGSETKRNDGIQSGRERMTFNKKRRCFNIYIYIYKIVGSQLGLPEPSGFCQAKSPAGFSFNPARLQVRVTRIPGQIGF